jgi:hypothetical protein
MRPPRLERALPQLLATPERLVEMGEAARARPSGAAAVADLVEEHARVA